MVNYLEPSSHEFSWISRISFPGARLICGAQFRRRKTFGTNLYREYINEPPRISYVVKQLRFTETVLKYNIYIYFFSLWLTTTLFY